MTKYILSIKDLVGQAITDLPSLKGGAEKGVASAVFKMGMIHLLGINTPIDFKKASSYFGNQSLADDSLANQLLGFIAECEGDFESAFNHYANAAEATGKGKNRPYYNKVFEQRGNVPRFFKEMKLPSAVLNKEISAIIAGYVKGGESKVDASIKIATICNDETSCLEAAQNLFDTGDVYGARKWLQKGNIASSNSLFVSVENAVSKAKELLLTSHSIQLIELKGESLLEDNDPFSSVREIEQLCIETSTACKQEWQEKVKKQIDDIISKIEDAERLREQKEEEEEERRKKRKKKLISYAIAYVLLFVFSYKIFDGSIRGAFFFSFSILVGYFFFQTIIKNAIEDDKLKKQKKHENY